MEKNKRKGQKIQRVKKVEYLDGYRLKLLFSDEKMKIVDLSDLIKEGGFYFDPLKEIEFFKKVSLDDEKYPLSIRWPNDADVCPDVLYEMGEEVEEHQKTIKKRRRKHVSLATPAMAKKRPKQAKG